MQHRFRRCAYHNRPTGKCKWSMRSQPNPSSGNRVRLNRRGCEPKRHLSFNHNLYLSTIDFMFTRMELNICCAHNANFEKRLRIHWIFNFLDFCVHLIVTKASIIFPSFYPLHVKCIVHGRKSRLIQRLRKWFSDGHILWRLHFRRSYFSIIGRLQVKRRRTTIDSIAGNKNLA